MEADPRVALAVQPAQAQAHTGSITLILGPMFSGKSTELMRRVRRFTFARKRCLVCKYKQDQRYAGEDTLATHDRQTMVARPCEKLADIESLYRGFDVIGIDEGQFFPDLNEFCERAANEGKVVIVAALDGTFERKPFGTVCELVPLAERVEKLTAVCRVTGADAAFSRRLGSATEVELIGGAEMYMPVSRSGYFTPASEAASPRVVVSPVSVAAVAELGATGPPALVASTEDKQRQPSVRHAATPPPPMPTRAVDTQQA